MSNLIHVPFHGSTLYIVDYSGEPFVPMKPIVEGMGLDWASQTVKLNSNKNRWGVVMITIPSVGGMQEALCIPHRKLPAWLASIQPSRVKPEIRDTIIAYQNECDDVLWDYWNKGRAINPREINIVDIPKNYSAADLRALSTAARAASEAARISAEANRILADTALALANQYENHSTVEKPASQTQPPQPKSQPALLPPREAAFIQGWWHCLGDQTVTASDL